MSRLDALIKVRMRRADRDLLDRAVEAAGAADLSEWARAVLLEAARAATRTEPRSTPVPPRQ